MQSRLRNLARDASNLSSGPEQQRAAIALLRIGLQHACIGLAEWLVRHIASSGDARLPNLDDLRQPSDGALVDALAALLVAAEAAGWNGVSRGYFSQWRAARPASRHVAKGRRSLFTCLHSFVLVRNDALEGHGLPGDDDPEALLDLVAAFAEYIGEALPQIQSDGSLSVTAPDGRATTLELLRTVDGNLICYRKIQKRPSGRCRITAQIQRTLSSREPLNWEAEDVLAKAPSAPLPLYRELPTFDDAWNPIGLIPERLTDSFQGRNRQLDELFEWINDTESKACLVFGDGGIGKTTLIIEFVQRLLECNPRRPDWRPEMITFFTAKKTKWGLHGLQVTGFGPSNATDVATSIYSALEEASAPRQWYDRPETIVDKLAHYLNESWGISRNEHLLILDNTETMAESDEDIVELTRLVHQLSRRVGRLLITSRRREPFEARNVELPPLTEDESLGLLRARATDLRIQSLQTAGDSALRRYARALGNRPLVLEVFVQTLTEPNLGLQRAFDRVQRMQRQDLGEFLYADAWNRFSVGMQHLLLLMTRVSDVHDEPLLKLCCLEANVSVMSAYEALQESRGIATLSQIAGHHQVALAPDFLEYCRDRSVAVRGVELPTNAQVQRVMQRYESFIAVRSKKIEDRVSRAFRKPFARMAWQAFQRQQYGECRQYYELAVAEDPDNALLFDRYAMFLFTRMGALDEALGCATRATELDGKSGEVWFTRGVIEGRLGNTQSALVSLRNALRHGKPTHLVYVQITHALLRAKPPRLHEAEDALHEAERSSPKGEDWLLDKHWAEISRLRRRIQDGFRGA